MNEVEKLQARIEAFGYRVMTVEIDNIYDRRLPLTSCEVIIFSGQTNQM
jgi:hypothetical protein